MITPFGRRNFVNQRQSLSLSSYQDLHDWSVQSPSQFWSGVWDFTELKGEKGNAPYFKNESDFLKKEFFPEARSLLEDGLQRQALFDALNK